MKMKAIILSLNENDLIAANEVMNSSKKDGIVSLMYKILSAANRVEFLDNDRKVELR